MNDQNGAELRGGMFFCPEALRKLSPGFSPLEPFKLSDDVVRQADVYHQKISEEHPYPGLVGFRIGGAVSLRRRRAKADCGIRDCAEALASSNNKRDVAGFQDMAFGALSSLVRTVAARGWVTADFGIAVVRSCPCGA
jgi:hypothetical protein